MQTAQQQGLPCNYSNRKSFEQHESNKALCAVKHLCNYIVVHNHYSSKCMLYHHIIM
ncbi:UNVERIFIED_CONTAM: hypothetical protein FKN15_039570 [Acipenser sinensis]